MATPSQRLTVKELLCIVRAVLETENDVIANMANVSALIYEALPDVNWAGFYLLKNNELVLGPFQGRIACTRIVLGRGICGMAARHRETQRVADVHAFPGHIACDAASSSEVVVPVVVDDTLVGVLDVGSPVQNRFTAGDQEILEKIVKTLEERIAAAH